MLHIYNSLSRKKEEFKPIHKNKVQMYVCGMTVYDLCHLGHARVLVVFDMVTRYLRFRGYDVTYVRNITDIDDKIIARAEENGEPFEGLTDRFIKAMHEDSEMLNVLPPDMEPRATTHIDDILSMIQTLMDKGFAYQGDKGDVYYSVRQFPGYGKLSGKNLDELQAGARVDQDDDKADPSDFVLWKMAKPGEPKWDSPWGEGRPGWHIECSAMSTQCLGNHFDIHAGGMDLQFPHHENEIAQSEGATGECFANLWMHNGYVQINKEKMSKSLGNFFTIREILAQDSIPERMGEIIRFMVLTSHYRSPLNYSDDTLANARTGLTRLNTVAERIRPLGDLGVQPDGGWVKRFQAAMDDDFNTPEAIAVVFDLAREINRLLDQAKLTDSLVVTFFEFMKILGLLELESGRFLGISGDFNDEVVVGYTQDAVNEALTRRAEAKENKDWATADKIRDELTDLGVLIEDKPGGEFSWRVG